MSDSKENKIENKEEAKRVWSVTFTDYSDDYKPRGGDWSSIDGPYLFATEKAARAFLTESLGEWCHERLDEMLWNVDEVSDRLAGWVKRYRKIEQDELDNKSDEALETTHDGIEKLADEISRGTTQYIARAKSWELKSDTLGDDTGAGVYIQQLKKARVENEGDDRDEEEEEGDDEKDDQKATNKRERQEEEDTEGEPTAKKARVVQTSDTPGAVLVHTQGNAQVVLPSPDSTNSGRPVATLVSRSDEGTPIIQVLRAPGSVAVCALGRSRIVMRT